MTSRYRHRRSSNPATAFPAPLEPGEIAVNTANRQIAAGDVADGSPHDLIAVRFFDTHAIYAVNDIVDYNGNLYRAAVPNGPGAFNGANWTANGTQVFFGDTAPSPATALDGSFFWETDSGTLFVMYNDGNSRQWVIASPQPDPTTFVLRAGDTMGGPLTLAGDPTTPMMAATKQYVDAGDGAATTLASGKVSKTGDTMSGALKVPVKSNLMGIAGGVSAPLWNAPQTQAEANVLLYDLTGNNWAGFGVDNSGDVWLRLGTSGTPVPAFALTTDQIAHFAQPPLAPTPPVDDLSTKVATTEFVKAWAAPMDALAYSGLQYNGSFDVWQEYGVNGPGAGFAATTRYVADGWLIQTSGAQVMTAIGTPAAAPGFTTALQMYPGTPNASPGVNDYCLFTHLIEGYRTARLAWGTANAQPLTIGFFVYSSRTGQHAGSVRNNGNNRSFIFTYTVNVARTWEYKVITIPGDTAGTWGVSTNYGINLSFTALAGTNQQTGAGGWRAGAFLSTPGSVNLCTTTSDLLIIDGVIVLPGLEAPSAARAALIMRPYDQELLTAKRYYLRQAYAAGGFWTFTIDPTGTPYRRYFLSFTPEMRIAPTITIAGSTVGVFQSGYPIVNNVTTFGCQVLADATGAGAYSYITSLILDARF